MSHTKKKFITIKTNSSNQDDLFKKYAKERPKHIDIDEFDRGGLFTEDGKKMITAFTYVYKSKPFLIPEPDITILYLSFVEKSVESIINIRKQILELGSKQDIKLSEKLANSFYSFFQLSAGFVIFSMMSLEAFNNSLIPNEHT